MWDKDDKSMKNLIIILFFCLSANVATAQRVTFKAMGDKQNGYYQRVETKTGAQLKQLEKDLDRWLNDSPMQNQIFEIQAEKAAFQDQVRTRDQRYTNTVAKYDAQIEQIKEQIEAEYERRKKHIDNFKSL